MYSKNSKKNYNFAYGENLKKIQTVITSVVYKIES